MKYPVVYFEMLFVGFLLVFGYSMLQSFLPIFAGELDPTGVLVGFSISSRRKLNENPCEKVHIRWLPLWRSPATGYCSNLINGKREKLDSQALGFV
jgi:hypothetical protein